MDVTWTRLPASLPGPVVIVAEADGTSLRVSERGDHWFASVTYPDGDTWSVACRTKDEAKMRALEAAGATGGERRGRRR